MTVTTLTRAFVIAETDLELIQKKASEQRSSDSAALRAILQEWAKLTQQEEPNQTHPLRRAEDRKIEA
jgi:hypothetical protein